MAFNLFRKNSDDEPGNQQAESREQAPVPGSEQRSASESRARDARQELPTENGLSDLVELMDRFKVSTLRLDQHGNEMTAVMDPSEGTDRSTVVDTESAWFEAVARLYTTAQNSSRGPWRRVEIELGSAHEGRRGVEVEYTYPNSQKQDREEYGQTVPEPRTAATSHEASAATGQESSAGAGSASVASAETGKGSSEPARTEVGKTEYDAAAAARTESGEAGKRPAEPARTEIGKTEYDPSAAEKSAPVSETERKRALEDLAEDADRRKQDHAQTSGPAGDGETARDGAAGGANTSSAPEKETPARHDGTHAAVAGGATVVGTAAVVGAAGAETADRDRKTAAGQDKADAAAPAQQKPAASQQGIGSEDSATGTDAAGHEPVPDVVDDADLETSPEAPSSTGSSSDRRSSALPDTAPSTAENADVAPSFSAQQAPAAQISSTRLAPGNLVLTEADVLGRLADAQTALFGAGGSARDVSTVLIRVRALGSYYDALTHVRTNGLWDQRATFDLVPEELLRIPEFKADSYREGAGSPVAIMFRFTPGVPPQAEFDYGDEEAFVKYADRLPAQQYIEELRLFPRTGSNIPEHMNEALAQWSL